MTHLVLASGDKRTACGLRDKKDNRPQTPYVHAKFVARYDAKAKERGREDRVWCETCLGAAHRAGLIF